MRQSRSRTILAMRSELTRWSRRGASRPCSPPARSELFEEITGTSVDAALSDLRHQDASQWQLLRLRRLRIHQRLQLKRISPQAGPTLRLLRPGRRLREHFWPVRVITTWLTIVTVRRWMLIPRR